MIDDFDIQIQSDEFAMEYLQYLEWCREVEGEYYVQEDEV